MIVLTKYSLGQKGYPSLIPAASLTVLAITAGGAQAQINIGGANPSTYNQNFNSPVLANTGTTASFTNNVTLTGLYATRAGVAPTTYRISNGSDATDGLYSHGATNNNDRALGSLIASVNNVFFGFRFVNTSPGLAITSFNMQYIGEQWRRATNAANSTQQLTFSYAVFNANTGSINDPDDYNTFTNLNFVVTNTGAPASINAPITTQSFNQTVILEDQDEVVLPGQELWIRWQDTNDNGLDHGLAIDNVQMSFTLVPEVSTLHAMLLAGSVALVPAWRMARRRKTSTL